MGIQSKQIFIASDGSEFDTEQAARDRELKIELQPVISQFLETRSVYNSSRIRGTVVAEILSDFAVHLLTPPEPPQDIPEEAPVHE